MPVGKNQKLVQCLRKAHEAKLINMHMEATYDASINDGDVVLEVLLLPKVRIVRRESTPDVVSCDNAFREYGVYPHTTAAAVRSRCYYWGP